MKNKIDGYFIAALVLTLTFATWLDFSREPVRVAEIPEVVQEEPEYEESEDDGRPDFAAMTDVKQKKHLFFEFIRTMVNEENNRLLSIRKRVAGYQKQKALAADEVEWLLKTASRFRVKHANEVTPELFDGLLMNVDAIPASLAMVQAANESAWGTSRFALDANNYFGQWCFSKGCGLVPSARPEGATYEVQKFDSPADSVRSYMNNLNTSHHYTALREIRAKSRQAGEPVTGAMLAHGLYAYSQRGHAYVEELVAMINSNKLLQYDLNN